MAAKKLASSVPTLDGIERTGQGLRDALFDEIDMIRQGNGDRRRAVAIATLAGRVMETVKIEIEYAKQMSLASKNGREAAAIGSLQLGRA